jgi:nitrate reductase delta subunit
MNKELEALAFLLIYPRRQSLEKLDDIRPCLLSSALFTEPVKETLKQFFSGFHKASLQQLQNLYVRTFDMPSGASLNLSRLCPDRASAARLIALYSAHGQSFDCKDVPDFLPAVLEFLSAVSENEARSWLQSASPLLESLRKGLQRIDSPWLAVADALQNFGAGRTEHSPSGGRT